MTLSLIITAACSDDTTSSPRVTTERPDPVTTPTSVMTTTTGPTSSAENLEDFCVEAARSAEDVPQSYIGTDEHVAQLRQLATLAPATIRDELEVMAQHFQDNVDPSNPPSQFYDGFPESVKAAIGEVDRFVQEHCNP